MMVTKKKPDADRRAGFTSMKFRPLNIGKMVIHSAAVEKHCLQLDKYELSSFTAVSRFYGTTLIGWLGPCRPIRYGLGPVSPRLNISTIRSAFGGLIHTWSSLSF